MQPTAPAAADPLSLRPPDVLGTLDAAFTVLRRSSPSHALRGFAAGLPVAAVVLVLYFLERVEGITSLRAPLAALLVTAFLVRCVVLGGLARRFVVALRPALPMSPRAGSILDVALTASVVALGVWVWLWPVAGLLRVSPLAVVLAVPLLALRGAVAPSWLARSACARHAGLAAFGHAVEDTRGVRATMFLVELCVLLGGLGLFVNLFALLSTALALSSSFLGLDVAFVSAFSSLDNELVLLLLGSTTLVALEPLRAAVSAHCFAEARGRRDGADLHAAIDAIVGAAVLLACLGGAAQAQPVAPPPRGGPPVVDDGDARVREELRAILEQQEFRELAASDAHGFWTWLKGRLQRWLQSQDVKETTPKPGELQLPEVSPWLIMFLALLVLTPVLLHATASRRNAAAERAPGASGAPRAASAVVEPAALLDEAAAFAQRGEFRQALRTLYVATLTALDRAQVIRYEVAKTNGQYLRAMPAGALRDHFASFTRVFDRTWYGDQPATEDDYLRCRRLADRLVHPPEAA